MNNINNLILTNISLAEEIAKSKKKSIHSSISYDEIKSAAYFGLIEAAHAFDPRKEIPFRVFAFKKIIWSIKNYLRELCWGNKRNKIKCLSLSECDFLSLSEKKQTSIYFEFDKLTKIQKKILFLKFVEKLKNKQIALVLNFSESRISQILSEIKKKLQTTCSF